MCLDAGSPPASAAGEMVTHGGRSHMQPLSPPITRLSGARHGLRSEQNPPRSGTWMGPLTTAQGPSCS